MTNEKNTQNADMPTKDTRQYKHTPSKRKRLVGKICALVGCLAVLLSCLALPASADTVTDEDAGIVPAPLLMPSTMAFPVYADADTGAYFTYDIPYAINYRLFDQQSPFYDWDVEYEYYGFSPYSLNVSNECSLDIQTGLFTYYADFEGTPRGSLHEAEPTYLSFTPFNYDYRYLKRWLPTVLGSNFMTLDYYDSGAEESDISYWTVEYDISYTAYDEDTKTTYTNEPSIEFQYSFQGYKSSVPIDLNRAFTNLGIVDQIIHVNRLDVVIYPNDDPTAFELGSLICQYGTPEDPVIVFNTVQQVVNEGTFSNLFDWLGSTVSGFLDASLFTIGEVVVTPAIILGAVLSLLLIFAFLRFFSGG